MSFEFQKSFAAGEISPKLWLRNDSRTHGAAVKTLHNMIAEPHGPASSRLGFEFIDEIGDEENCRLFSFITRRTSPFAVVVTKSKIIILDDSGSSLQNQFIQNPDFDDNGVNWDSTNVSFAIDSVAKLDPQYTDFGPDPEEDVELPPIILSANIRQAITVDNGANPHNLTIHCIEPNADAQIKINIGTTSGANDILATTGSGSKISIYFTPNVTNFWIEIETENQVITEKYISKVALAEIVIVPGAGSRVELDVSPNYTDTDLRELQVDYVPGEDIMYLFTRGHFPYQIDYANGLWTHEEITFSFGSGSNPWGTDYPGCITFHDSRLVIGGTVSKPVTIWLSKPNDFTNFDEGASDNAADAMELTLSKNGELRWLQSNTKLFAGLDTGEHVIFGNNGPLSVMNAQTEQQSAYGSYRAHAVVVNEQIVYIDARGKTVRAMQYSDTQNAFTSDNASFQAEHITKEGLFELEYGISPIGMIWFPTLNGNFVSVSIEKDQQTTGWQSHSTQGDIVSMSTLRDTGVSVPWVAVIRDGKLLIERMSFQNNIFVDSGLEVSSAALATVFFGFDHLIGHTVHILVDGKVHPNVIVAEDGSITTNYEAYKVLAGYQFIPSFETLPSQMDTDQGNTISFNKRYSELAIYLLDCPRPVVNGCDLYLRTQGTSMGSREANETGLVIFGNDTGWDREATITVSQPLPLPLTVSAIGGKLKVNKV